METIKNNKILHKLFIFTIIFMLLGFLLLIIGLSVKATIDYKTFDSHGELLFEVNYSTSIISKDIMEQIRQINVLHDLAPRIWSHYSPNLFGSHKFVKDLLDAATADRSYSYSIDFFTKLFRLSNVAIAGFSFIMISILTSMAFVPLFLKIKKEELNENS